MADNFSIRDASGNTKYAATTDLGSDVHVRKVQVVGPAGGSTTKTDDAAFTPGTDAVVMAGATFDDTSPDSVNEGDAGALRMSANRNLYTTIRDAAGNERGANVDAYNRVQAVLEDAGHNYSATIGLATDNVAANVGSILVASQGMQYDPTASVYTRIRGIHELTLLSSAARTATTTSADFTNYNCKGAIFVVDITAVPGVETVQLEVQAGNSIVTKYIPVISGTTQSATGTTWVLLYPTTMGAANWNNYANGILPKTFRIKMTHSASGSFTYSVTALMLL